MSAKITNRLRELREERMNKSSHPEKWTQEGLAAVVRVSRQTIIAIEKGTYNPSLSLAFKLAHAFGLAIEEIFNYGGDMNEK
ncbi:MAG: helix-turn-helix transcriptional regulator [Candidatus Heimdallarchaeaceae archaeon]|jgi:putative transcriptional regulator